MTCSLSVKTKDVCLWYTKYSKNSQHAISHVNSFFWTYQKINIANIQA